MNLPTEVRYRPYADWTNEEKTKKYAKRLTYDKKMLK